MSEESWTAELWRYERNHIYGHFVKTGEQCIARFDIVSNGPSGDAMRTVSAVNGCAGIPKPEGLGVLVEKLKEITEGKGRYSMDHLQHAANCVEDMKTLALEALRACGLGEDDGH